MVAAAREAKVTLMVAHNLRFVPIYQVIERGDARWLIGRPFGPLPFIGALALTPVRISGG
jgi:hypothetical protein